MLRISQLWKLPLLGLLMHASIATAQQTPSSAPPILEKIEPGSDKPILIPPNRDNERKITEKKENGRTTEVKVKTGKSEYTMKPNTPAGNAQPGDGQSNAIRAPQWTVLEFDLNRKKKTDPKAVTEAADVPPPPPMAKDGAKPSARPAPK